MMGWVGLTAPLEYTAGDYISYLGTTLSLFPKTLVSSRNSPTNTAKDRKMRMTTRTQNTFKLSFEELYYRTKMVRCRTNYVNYTAMKRYKTKILRGLLWVFSEFYWLWLMIFLSKFRLFEIPSPSSSSFALILNKNLALGTLSATTGLKLTFLSSESISCLIIPQLSDLWVLYLLYYWMERSFQGIQYFI